MKLNRNRIYSLCVIAFALFLIYMTSQISSLFSLSDRDVGPKLFPYASAVGLIICAIGKFITEGGESKPVFTKEGWKRIVTMFVLLALYLVCMYFVGYIIATPIFTALGVIAMREDRKIKPVTLVVFSIATTVVLYLVFVKIILVFLPSGVLFG